MNTHISNMAELHQHNVESVRSLANQALQRFEHLYNHFGATSRFYLDSTREAVAIASNPNVSESIAQWPALVERNMEQVRQLNKSYSEITQENREKLARIWQEKMPTFLQTFQSGIQQWTQMLDTVVANSGNGQAGGPDTGLKRDQRKKTR